MTNYIQDMSMKLSDAQAGIKYNTSLGQGMHSQDGVEKTRTLSRQVALICKNFAEANGHHIDQAEVDQHTCLLFPGVDSAEQEYLQ
jgi:hypothetical protein